MVSFLVKIFSKKDSSPAHIRNIYGYICGIAGIFLNVVLFLLKLFIGSVSSSVSITADAFNNLGDAGSSAMSLFGFVLSGQKADKEHPFGHGRIEYVAGTLISTAIIFVGIELFKSSVSSIINPREIVFNAYVALILVFSILIKLYMAFYNKSASKKTGSPSLNAVALDSISDSIATLAILLSSVFMHFTGIYIDGYVGSVVSLLIIRTGIKSVIETAAPLLGKAPDREFVKSVEEIVRKSPETVGIHDLVVHEYGPNKRFVSLHMEVDGSRDLFLLHDEVDLVEREICSSLGCEAIIHMDPIDVNNPIIKELFTQLSKRCSEMDFSANIHDLRIVPGPTHTNVIFDLVLPPDAYGKKDIAVKELEDCIKNIDENYYAVITTETSYI